MDELRLDGEGIGMTTQMDQHNQLPLKTLHSEPTPNRAQPFAPEADPVPVPNTMESSWCEISQAAIRANMSVLRHRVGPMVKLGVVVKADGFGHGMVPCAREFLAAGADWLIVNFAYEAVTLREAGLDAPIYICGNVPVHQCDRVIATRSRIVLYDPDVAKALSQLAQRSDWTVPVHLKIETGTHRQGLYLDDALKLADLIQELDGLQLEGLTTHYADIEDTTDHQFAQQQLAGLNAAKAAFTEAGFDVPMIHSANSAATILWPHAHGSLVRVGLASYGLWPSTETYATVLQTALAEADNPKDPRLLQEAGDLDRDLAPKHFIPHLSPVLSWRTRIAQVKSVPTGGYISYGRTFRANYPMRVAVLPLGYHEGYDRRLSNLGYVLIHGQRAPICGRICMNMMVVDVTHIAAAQVGSVATLLGQDGNERISAEQLAAWMGTINYEVVARIHPSQPRLLVQDGSEFDEHEDAKSR
ncbi:MAG: alanine racemase [Cyanothece sp. SIO2G6]|nr:alanine racemase [Cyanothece sp. SIO2G6]